MLTIRRAILKYELYDSETKKFIVKYKSINPDKKRGGKTLGEREIWSLAGDTGNLLRRGLELQTPQSAGWRHMEGSR